MRLKNDSPQLSAGLLSSIAILTVLQMLSASALWSPPAYSQADTPCGKPPIDAGSNRRLVVWKDCQDQAWYVQLTGGRNFTTFSGTVNSSAGFAAVENLTLEGGDVLDTSLPSAISFDLTAIQSYNDTYRFRVDAGAEVCIAGEGSLGADLLIGPDATAVRTPVNPRTLAACTVSTLPDDENCGRPTIDSQDATLARMWRECGTDHWHVLQQGTGAASVFSGQIISAGNIGSAVDLSLETESQDRLELRGDSEIDYAMTVSGQWKDEFVFSLKSAKRFCLRSNETNPRAVLVGRNAKPLVPPFDPINLVDGVCITDGGGSSSGGGSSGSSSGSSSGGSRTITTTDNPNPPYNGSEGTFPSSIHVPPVGFPVIETTGIPGQPTLQPHTGRFDITQDGTVIDGMDITGPVNVKANNVTIRNSRVTNGGNAYVIRLYPEFRNLVVEDSRLRGLGACSAVMCCGNYTARRLLVTGCADGLKVGDNTVVEDTLITELYRKVDANGNGTHNDGIQAVGGSNINIRRNTILGPYQMSTSAIILQGNFSDLIDVMVEDNYLSGGSYTTYTRNRNFSMQNVVVRNNVFEDNGWLYGYKSSDTGASWSANTFHFP